MHRASAGRLIGVTNTINFNELRVLGLDLVWSGTTGAARLVLTRDGPDSRVQREMRLVRPFKPKGKRRAEGDGNHHARIAGAMFAWVCGLVDRHTPDLVAIEVPDWHQGHRGREYKVLPALGRASGVLALTVHLLRRTHPTLGYMEVGATEAKKVLTGLPNAPKGKVARALYRQYPSLPFPNKSAPLDCYDAGAVAHAAAITYLADQQHP